MRILVTSCLAFLSLFVFAETIKIGYIDTDYVVNNLSQYQQSVDEISKEFDPKKQELLLLLDYIENLRKRLETDKFQDKESYELIISKLTEAEETFQQETEIWQETMNNKKIELLQKIELLINTAINELAISENYDLILYENAAFVSDKVDITKEVTERIQRLSL